MKVDRLIKILKSFPKNTKIFVFSDAQSGNIIPVTSVEEFEEIKETPKVINGFYFQKKIKKKKKDIKVLIG